MKKITGQGDGLRNSSAPAGGEPAPVKLKKPEVVEEHLSRLDTWGGSAQLRARTFALKRPAESAEILTRGIAVAARAARAQGYLATDTPGLRFGAGLSFGVASGVLIDRPEAAREALAEGRQYVFLCDQISPANVEALVGAQAIILTNQRRQRPSDPALSGLGKPVVALSPRRLEGLVAGSVVTVDGTQGAVAPGHVEPKVEPADVAGAARALNQAKPIQVTVDASTRVGIERALAQGADGVRVDADVFFQTPEVLPLIRRYMVETEAAPRRRLLERLLAAVRAQAEELVESAQGAEVSFALGTRSPKSYFPVTAEGIAEVATQIGLPADFIQAKVKDLGSGNSKLGLRGARWAVKDPDLFAAVARGVMEAYAARRDEGQAVGALKLVIPAVGLPGEMQIVRGRLEKERAAVEADFGQPVGVRFAAGIETASGALHAAGISQHADAFEYGLEDLTETLMGISRDDAHAFLPQLVEQGIYPSDPFQELSTNLAGKMVMVGQYLAGEIPNGFPATVRGALAADPNGVLLAGNSGITSFAVPPRDAIPLRIRAAHLAAAMEALPGHVFEPGPDLSRREIGARRLIDILAQHPESAVKGEKKGIPEGVTALEHLEVLLRKMDAGALAPEALLLEVPPDIVDQLARPVVDRAARPKVLAKGIGASPGCGQGYIALSHEKAEELEKAGKPYVLVVNEVHAEEVPAVRRAKGLISVRGGKTSHAAVIAANSDVPCVMNDKVVINMEARTVRIGKTILAEGSPITIDGTKGEVMPDLVPLLNPSKSDAYARLMTLADQHRRVKVMANADTPEEAINAFRAGASGIGLVRSEHMFFGEDRLLAFRTAILTSGPERGRALSQMEDMQYQDYYALLKEAGTKKCAIRLLDPPLYEFLPQKPEEIRDLAAKLGRKPEELAAQIAEAQEVDSLMGLRGVRLATVFPDIEAMQVRALARAYAALTQEGHRQGPLYITVPMINTGSEMGAAAKRIGAAIAEVEKSAGLQIPVKLGGMIETPAAALEAHRIAEHCDYFSYGTNDLTQLTLGFGRNVGAQFIPELISARALSGDPTGVLDRDTVGKMMLVAESLGHETKPLESGVCGAQGSDPESVRLVHELGLEYVSVPPAQVAKARLAGAQAALAKASQAEPATPGRDLVSSALDLTRLVTRDLKGIGQVPVPEEQSSTLERLRWRHSRLGSALNTARGRLSTAELAELLPAFNLHFHVGSVLASDTLAKSILAKAGEYERDFAAGVVPGQSPDARAPSSLLRAKMPKLLATLGEAKQAARRLGLKASERLAAESTTTASEREVASEAWAALRALERIDAELAQINAPTAHEHHFRLRHHNDGWDNNYYTRHAADPKEPFGKYLRKVAADFLQDNGLSVHLSGEENVPADRPVIYAVSHRSGAIDRFLVSATLVPEDDFMYLVRKGSPLDVRAVEAYGEGNKWMLTADSAAEVQARVKAGFEAGAKCLITYPAGTGPIIGEDRYVAAGTVLAAMASDAVIVPVNIVDSFAVRPLQGGSVSLHLGEPIDPAQIKKDLGPGATEDQVLRLTRALLQHDIGHAYRELPIG